MVSKLITDKHHPMAWWLSQLASRLSMGAVAAGAAVLRKWSLAVTHQTQNSGISGWSLVLLGEELWRTAISCCFVALSSSGFRPMPLKKHCSRDEHPAANAPSPHGGVGLKHKCVDQFQGCHPRAKCPLVDISGSDLVRNWRTHQCVCVATAYESTIAERNSGYLAADCNTCSDPTGVSSVSASWLSSTLLAGTWSLRMHSTRSASKCRNRIQPHPHSTAISVCSRMCLDMTLDLYFLSLQAGGRVFFWIVFMLFPNLCPEPIERHVALDSWDHLGPRHLVFQTEPGHKFRWKTTAYIGSAYHHDLLKNTKSGSKVRSCPNLNILENYSYFFMLLGHSEFLDPRPVEQQLKTPVR